jgi:high-affinity iron transporter
MLPTFVIGLREGLEAALIVGIIAAFLRQQGRRDLLRWVFVGVGAAVLLCVAVGATLEAVSSNLPQPQQEGLETVVGVLAVGMVTYMVVWMRKHSRELKSQLEGLAADAISAEAASGAGRAMVVMAFLAVLREGFETVVFLLAAFNESGSSLGAGIGALAGILLAVLLGYGIYRGGVRLNLSKFFRATGIVLVLVAAGLVVTALRTAHEAGWLDVGQSSTIDLTWLVRPGSVQSALLTGMLGIQDHPVLIELIGWLAYLVPVGLYVAWPPNRKLSRRALLRATSALTAAGALIAIVLVVLAPAAPTSAAADAIAGHRTGSETHDGLETDVYTSTRTSAAAAGRPTQLTYAQVAALNGGRLPLGVGTHGAATQSPDAQSPDAQSPDTQSPDTQSPDTQSPDTSVQVQYTDTTVTTVWIEPRTGRLIDRHSTETVRATVTGTQVGAVPLDNPVASKTTALPAAAVDAAVATARHDIDTLHRRSAMLEGAWIAGSAAGVAFLILFVLLGLLPLLAKQRVTSIS